MKVLNALIKDADLRLSNGTFLDLLLELKLEGGGCVCFGGIVLCNKDEGEDDCDCNYAGMYICKVLDIAGANSIANLKGKPIRAIMEGQGRLGNRIIGIQHFLDNKNYFIPNKDNETEEVKQQLLGN
jgi:hypothetical protein